MCDIAEFSYTFMKTSLKSTNETESLEDSTKQVFSSDMLYNFKFSWNVIYVDIFEIFYRDC